MANKIIHKHSSVIIDGKAKLPDKDKLEYGELAINYADGFETITIKNNSEELVEFVSKEYTDDLLDNLENRISENEEVTAFALTELDGKTKYTSSLDPNLKASSIGGIGSDITVSDLTGKTISSIIDDLLFPTIEPTYTKPSINGFKLSDSTSPVEIGTTASTITSATFNRGKWNDYNNNLPYAGDVDLIVYNFNINDENITGSTVPDMSGKKYTTVGNQTYSVTVSYKQGDYAKNNKGDYFENNFAPASSVTSTRIVNVTYPIYATTQKINELTKLPLISWNDSTITTEITVVNQGTPTNYTESQRFKIPRTLVSIETKNTLNNTWSNSSSDWTIVDENGTIENINGIDVKYYTYYYNSDSSIGEQIIKITF